MECVCDNSEKQNECLKSPNADGRNILKAGSIRLGCNLHTLPHVSRPNTFTLQPLNITFPSIQGISLCFLLLSFSILRECLQTKHNGTLQPFAPEGTTKEDFTKKRYYTICHVDLNGGKVSFISSRHL